MLFLGLDFICADLMVKNFHIVLAVLSATGFIIRLGWSFNAPELAAQKWVKIAPHIIDTLLLTLGLVLAFNLANGPWQGWLVAKMLGLLAYIGFGVLALRGTGTAKYVGAVGALASISYVFIVAFTRQAFL